MKLPQCPRLTTPELDRIGLNLRTRLVRAIKRTEGVAMSDEQYIKNLEFNVTNYNQAVKAVVRLDKYLRFET